MRAFIEAVMDLDRDTKGGGGDAGPRKPRGEGNGPKEGCYWHKGGALLPVEGSANEIVNHAGQAVMLDPEAYDLSAEEIMQWLLPYGAVDADYSPARDYQRFLNQETFNGKPFNPVRDALLWKASKIVFNKMLTLGWAWVIYHPPESIHIAVTPDFQKRALATLGNVLPLLQIDKIRLTLVTDFNDISAKWPHIGKNKTMVFSSDKIKGFAGTFGAALDYTNGKDAPAGNYLYLLASEHYTGPLAPRKMNVRTPEGYRQRWCIAFLPEAPEDIPEGYVLLRVPTSVARNAARGRSHWKSGIGKNKNGEIVMYADDNFWIKDHIEVLRDGKWVPRN